MFELKIIESGYFMADGGAMFGAIPKKAWSKKYNEAGNNLCRLAMRCILAVSEDRRILVDLGMGNKHLEAVKYYQPHNLADISVILENYGYNNDNITDVVITHLHFDHCGYATKKIPNGEVIASFPNARYWLSQKQWDNFMNPNLLEADALFADNILPIYEAGLLNFINKNTEIYDGFEVRLFDGHTSGQLVPYMETKNGIFVFPGDLIPTSAHIPLEWISAFDISAITSVEEKSRFLKEAVSNDYTLIYCHDSKIASSKVKQLNDNYKAVI